MSSEQQKQQVKTQSASEYNAFTHMIDKAIYNFFIGSGVAVALTLSIFFIFLRHQRFDICPLILLLFIIAGFIYAFGFMGVVAASTKEKSYKVTWLSAMGATMTSSASFVFPIFFVQMIVYFIMFLIPRYYVQLSTYVPRITNMKQALIQKYCVANEFCIYNTTLGKMVGILLDALILGIGLFVLFSFINFITATIKISSGSKSK